MIDPYTMQLLNAERLKDLDRESAGLRFSCLSRPHRRRAIEGARLRLADILIGAGNWIKRPSSHQRRRFSNR
jgi:hypothetical protein